MSQAGQTIREADPKQEALENWLIDAFLDPRNDGLTHDEMRIAFVNDNLNVEQHSVEGQWIELRILRGTRYCMDAIVRHCAFADEDAVCRHADSLLAHNAQIVYDSIR